MKVASNAADGFVRKPDPRLRAILVYGPDDGLVGERAVTAAKSACPDLADPFRVVEVTAAQLKDDPARLADEFAALSMMGGRRVVRVRPADDDAVPALENLLSAPSGDALVVLEAGDLRKTSALRQFAENSDRIAAVACYPDSEVQLGDLVDEMLRSGGLRPDADARAWIIDHLGGDRAQSRSELEKLVLYMGAGADKANDGKVTIDDAMAILGDTAAISMEDVVQATFDGALPDLDRALDRVFAEGETPVAIVRALQRHANMLHLSAGRAASGATPESLLARMGPMPFTRRAVWLRHFRLWPAPRAAEALIHILDAETDCKKTGLPGEALARRLCLRLGQSARRTESAARRR